jgi:hypothetical protein
LSQFLSSLRIGSVRLGDRVFLASVLGVIDAAFRRITRQFGASMVALTRRLDYALSLVEAVTYRRAA